MILIAWEKNSNPKEEENVAFVREFTQMEMQEIQLTLMPSEEKVILLWIEYRQALSDIL